ncbi:Ankyrin [Wickerhamomyces ciferrii]|uniref:Ankyrin n=1 Tax=Wickerhamomyces ciferrii (strain ATCC 14091 / BCRC 22168 / CBS 111 / JCM 3599 / NBRC 0793 / NRRL Y-1031 F-60-10) TaxID=1206466 RepID=K0KIQ4_WICCF|nr:Ankyrin [Wickerhamomyces ciferrii]CCH45095.1 Ankyrin [Wickerhamomyces ciferrii]
MVQQKLTQEEYDVIIDLARHGDLDDLKEIFEELDGDLLLEIKDEHTLTNPIHMACGNGHLEVVKYLLSKISKDQATKLINSQNNEGNTCLHWASLNGYLDIVKLLCDEYEADAFIKNKFQHDPIFEAENNNKDEVETYFLKKYDVEPIADEEGNVNININNESDVKIKPGEEIEQISKEKLASLQSNEEFIEERTKNLSL